MKIKHKLGHSIRCNLTRISPYLNTHIVYLAKFHRLLNLRKPTKLNDKVLWLKFHDYYNNEQVKNCADKYRVREFVEKKNCAELLNELIGAYHSVDEIEWNKLPNSCAIKLNIGCGFNHIVVNLKNEKIDELTSEIQDWFKKAPNSYLGYSEMQYKGVTPVLLVEKYLGGSNGELPLDYKFYCINGRVELIMCCVGRDENGHGAKYYYLDRNWNLVSGYGEEKIEIEKPVMLEKAIEYAEILSSDFPFVRVDFYLFESKIVFGELTFTPSAGMDIDHNRIVVGSNRSIDDVYGALLDL